MFMGASTKQGLDIANKSREIIRGLIGDDVKDLKPIERDIVERIVHSTADPEYAKLVKMSPDFVDAAMASLKNKETILDLISNNLKKDWDIQRISKVNLAILEIAIFEIKYTDIPFKVAINEAVELAKKYGDEAATLFVNGILASVVNEK